MDADIERPRMPVRLAGLATPWSRSESLIVMAVGAQPLRARHARCARGTSEPRSPWLPLVCRMTPSHSAGSVSPRPWARPGSGAPCLHACPTGRLARPSHGASSGSSWRAPAGTRCWCGPAEYTGAYRSGRIDSRYHARIRDPECSETRACERVGSMYAPIRSTFPSAQALDPAMLRDEKVVGSNPITPTFRRQPWRTPGLFSWADEPAQGRFLTTTLSA